MFYPEDFVKFIIAEPGRGGRSLVAALGAARHNPVLRPLYQRLRAAGKPAKVARVALRRKLAELANLLLKNPQLTITH
jgi:transposase